MKESNMPRADFIVSIVLIVFGIGVVWASVAMPRFEDQGGSFYDAPGMVPGIIGILVIALSVVMLIRAIIRKGYLLGFTGKSLAGALRSEGTMRIVVTIGVCVLYGLVLLRFLHFIAATIIFVFGFIMLFEYDLKKRVAEQLRTILFAVLTSAITTGAVYSVFQYLFLVNLP
jgi:hypothetical protein